MLADVVDLDDVGVLEPGDGLGLGQEADGGLGAGVRAGQDHLQGDGAVEPDLAGLVDDPHAAAAQLALDLVAGDGRRGAVGDGLRRVALRSSGRTGVPPAVHGRCRGVRRRDEGRRGSRSEAGITGASVRPRRVRCGRRNAREGLAVKGLRLAHGPLPSAAVLLAGVRPAGCAAGPDEALPRVVVILPIRSADPSLASCLSGLLLQNYPCYDVWVVIDSGEDPAWEVEHRALGKPPAGRVQVSLPEPGRPTCSLKLSALVQAIAARDRFGGIPIHSAHGGKPISFSTWANRGSWCRPSRVGSTLIQITRAIRSSQDLRSHSNA